MQSSTHDVSKRGNLIVVKDQCQFAADRSSAIIVIQSVNPKFPLAIDELMSRDVRDMAIAYAATEGVSDPRINGNVDGPYPINDDDKPIETVRADDGTLLPPTHIKMQPAAYRANVPVTRRLI